MTNLDKVVLFSEIVLIGAFLIALVIAAKRP